MKTIKAFLTVSALATIASVANATVWDITLSGSNFIVGFGSPLIMNLSGIYDDAATSKSGSYGPGVADVSGFVDIPGLGISINYSHIYIDMPGTEGRGWLNPPNGSASNCTGTPESVCDISQGFFGSVYNDINFAYVEHVGNQFDQSAGTPFTAALGNYTWTLVIMTIENGKQKINQLPLATTLNLHSTPDVPLPATAWLFGSGILGLVGATRRHRGI